MPNESGLQAHTLVDLLRLRANEQGSLVAIEYYPDDPEAAAHVWTYAQLLEKSTEVAQELIKAGDRGSRGILLYPHGCDFLAGFWGCLLAGWIPVPSCYPRAGRAMPRLDSVAENCQPSAILSTAATLDAANPGRWSPAASKLPRLATDTPGGPSWRSENSPKSETRSNNCDALDAPSPSEIALLQFTSGSTNQPKGVMVTHANLMANLECIRLGFGLPFNHSASQEQTTGVFWLPPFHDMGLIGGLLTPLYLGGRSVLLSPQNFLARPARWLEMIHRHQAVFTGAPNFAYQLCVERVQGPESFSLDLSSLKIAFCGAEPIQPRVLEQFCRRFAGNGFQAHALLACYGLAEATLYVAGSRPGAGPQVLTVDRENLERQMVTPVGTSPLQNIDHASLTATARSHSENHKAIQIVSCGYPANTTDVAIVSPESGQQRGENEVGEIWVRGPSVATGYWPTPGQPVNEENPPTTTSNFNCELHTSDGAVCGFYRTGDLGFLHEGQLFITGRLKDLIILRGRNLYPQDIEETVGTFFYDNPTLAAAFSLDGPTGEGLAIVVEAPRTMDPSAYPDLVRSIRRQVIEVHEVDPRHIVLARPASIPITSSGKVRRSATREALVTEQLPSRYRWNRADFAVDGSPLPFPELPSVPNAEDVPAIIDSIQSWIISWLSLRTGIRPERIEAQKPWDSYSLDSLAAFELSGDVEDWLSIRLNPVSAIENDTPEKLARYLADQYVASLNQR